jgi:hypothetical protein
MLHMHKNLIQLSINEQMDTKNTRQNAYAILWAPLILHSYSILAASWLSSLWVLDSNIVCKRDWSRKGKHSVLPKDSSCCTYSSQWLIQYLCVSKTVIWSCVLAFCVWHFVSLLHPTLSVIELEIQAVMYFQRALAGGPTNSSETHYMGCLTAQIWVIGPTRMQENMCMTAWYR